MVKSERCHWLWAAFSKEATLLYGCLVHAAELGATIPKDERRSTVTFGGSTVEVIQALVNDSKAAQIADTVRAQSKLDLSCQGGPNILLSGCRHRLTDGFGRCARPMETHVGAEKAQLSDEDWHKAIDFLKDAIGLDFRRTPDRLGSFDIYDRLEGSGGNPLVRFRVDRESSADALAYPREFILDASGDGEDNFLVHVELELGQEPVFSRLITIKSGTSVEVKAVPYGHYRMSIFDQSGILIQSEEHSLLLRVSLNMSAMGATLAIDDSLARSAQGLGSELQNRASKVRTRSTTRSMIAAENDIDFEVHQTSMRALVHRLVPPSGSDRWFPRGISHEVGVIAHFNKLLDGARVSACTIVDPYFGVDTLKRVISRLESLDVDLTVVSSLLAIDPETDEPNPNLLDELQTVLRGLRSSGVPNAASRLKVLNLVDGPRQAFHDRYLLLTPHEGEREVYLLSNSLNRMAGKWPFCMSKLEGVAARDAALYIDGLASGRDISGSTQPVATFQWPSDEGR